MHRALWTLLLVTISLVVSAGANCAPLAHPLVPTSAYLVANESGRLLVLDHRGRLVRRVPRFAAPRPGAGVQALALAPDRRFAYVSVYAGLQHPPRLYKVSLATGRRMQLAEGISPTLSPDRTRLAYITVAMRDGIQYLTALVIRDLPWRQARAIALPPRDAFGTPPDLVINWSPDGRSIAVSDGTGVRVVDVSTATTVESQPAIPGGTGLAPVFLDRHTIVVLANCCIGRQDLVAVDLRSGVRTPFAQLASPVENVRRLGHGTLLAVTALHRLVRVTPGRVHVLARGVLAATP